MIYFDKECITLCTFQVTLYIKICNYTLYSNKFYYKLLLPLFNLAFMNICIKFIISFDISDARVVSPTV